MDISAKIGNSNGFSVQKQMISKKKKVFTEIETNISAKIGNSNGFSAQKQVISKKKKKKKVPLGHATTLIHAKALHSGAFKPM